jgi:TRAP-type C4-dicarboxylate transport system permease large subunit
LTNDSNRYHTVSANDGAKAIRYSRQVCDAIGSRGYGCRADSGFTTASCIAGPIATPSVASVAASVAAAINLPEAARGKIKVLALI